MNLKNYKHIHLIGIGGINVSAIAKLMLAQGKKVSGSDLAATDLTAELEQEGARFYLGHKRENLAPEVDLVIYTDAVPPNNPERLEARERTIETMSAFKFWGAYSRDKKVVAVSGTNGKSTTTAMVGLIMEAAGLDPTVVVGTKVLQWGSNIRIGKSDWLVIEADEYRGHMLEFNPYVAVITNIAPDHLDYYKDLDDIVAHFQKWIGQISPDGCLVLNEADPASRKLRPGKIKTINDNPTLVGLKLKVPGKFNLANALAAASAARFLGVDDKIIVAALNGFTGTWRRFEKVGEYNGALIISDYAHHPDGVKVTLAAARERYPHQRLVLLYQPHQHNRTRKLFDDFVKSFDQADELILSEIYDVAGREQIEDQKVSSKDLAEGVKKHLAQKGFQAKLKPGHVSFAPDLEQAEKMLQDKIQPDDIVIVMGAGDVDSVARNLVKK